MCRSHHQVCYFMNKHLYTARQGTIQHMRALVMWVAVHQVCLPPQPCQLWASPWSCLMQAHSHQANQANSQLGSCWSYSLFSLAGLLFVVLSSQLCCYICVPPRSLFQYRTVVFPHLQNTLVQTPCDSALRGQLWHRAWSLIVFVAEIMGFPR